MAATNAQYASRKMTEIRRGAILNYTQLILQIGIPLMLTPFIMEALGPAEYGVYMLAGTIMVRLYMSDLGRTATTKFLSEYRAKGDTAGAARFLGNMVSLYAVIGLIILVVGLCVYPWLGEIFHQFSETELNLYRPLYLMTLFNAALMFPARSLLGVADAEQKFTIPGLITVATSATNALGTILLLWLGMRSKALIGLSIGTGIMALLCHVGYCFIGLKAKICWQGWSAGICRGIIIFSFWMFLNQLINMLNAGTGNYIVAITQGAVSAGVYTNGLLIYGHYFMLAGAVSALFLPRVVHMVLRGATPQEQTDAMVRLGRIQWMILGGVLLILIYFGQEFYRLWIGHIPGANAELSYRICLCLVIPQTFGLVQALGWQISQARDALRQRVLITGFNSLLFIVVSYFVCQSWGIVAQAAWAAISILIQLAMLNGIHYRTLGLGVGHFYKMTFRNALPTMLICSGVCIGLNYLIPSGHVWGFFLKCLIFLPLYIGTIYRFYATAEEKRLLRAIKPGH